MVEQDTLFYAKGPQCAALLNEFRRTYPLQWAMPTSSGTAALHVAVAALQLPPGSEIITSPVTDMGSVIGALYQQCVPVFADIDPETCREEGGCELRASADQYNAFLAGGSLLSAGRGVVTLIGASFAREVRIDLRPFDRSC